MRNLFAGLVFLSLVLASACSDASPVVVRVISAPPVPVPVASLPVGRYQTWKDRALTWRFDTATGQICVLLASDDDWKAIKEKHPFSLCAIPTTETP